MLTSYCLIATYHYLSLNHLYKTFIPYTVGTVGFPHSISNHLDHMYVTYVSVYVCPVRPHNRHPKTKAKPGNTCSRNPFATS